MSIFLMKKKHLLFCSKREEMFSWNVSACWMTQFSARSQINLSFHFAKKAYYNTIRKESQMSILSSPISMLFFLQTTQPEGTKSTKCIRTQKFAGVKVSGRVWRWEIGGSIGNVEALPCLLKGRECGTESLQACHGDTELTYFEPKTRHSVWEAKLCSKVEGCIWFRAQECRRREWTVIPCTMDMMQNFWRK